jgi:hypothetical protein
LFASSLSLQQSTPSSASRTTRPFDLPIVLEVSASTRSF